MKPRVYDFYCGLGGWTEAFLAEGYDAVGFDIERHDYGSGGYPGQLVLQDVCTIHGAQLVDAAALVSSSPCQEFSYRAMPWKRAKALGPPVLGINLFWQPFRIQQEIFEACGRWVPLVAENVRGAEKWIGEAEWKYGSFYLWGDVPALMPIGAHRKHRAHNPAAVGWFGKYKPGADPMRNTPSHSLARKAASAAIAKIPFPLAQHIARVYKPEAEACA